MIDSVLLPIALILPRHIYRGRAKAIAISLLINRVIKEVKEFRELSDYLANLTNFPILLTQLSIECNNVTL